MIIMINMIISIMSIIVTVSNRTNVVPHIFHHCYVDSMCDKLHPSSCLPLVLQVVCWKLFHTSACCTVWF